MRMVVATVCVRPNESFTRSWITFAGSPVAGSAGWARFVRVDQESESCGEDPVRSKTLSLSRSQAYSTTESPHTELSSRLPEASSSRAPPTVVTYGPPVTATGATLPADTWTVTFWNAWFGGIRLSRTRRRTVASPNAVNVCVIVSPVRSNVPLLSRSQAYSESCRSGFEWYEQPASSVAAWPHVTGSGRTSAQATGVFE